VPSLLKKTMVYLGLLDDEYDDYEDDYEERGSKGFTQVARLETRTPEPDQSVESPRDPRPVVAQSGRIRALPRENGTGTPCQCSVVGRESLLVTEISTSSPSTARKTGPGDIPFTVGKTTAWPGSGSTCPDCNANA